MRFPLHITTDMIEHQVKHALKGNKRYPMVLMLEPLYTCNLACLGCSTERHTGKLSDRLYLMLVSPVEGLGCRQLTAVWRFRGLARYGRAGREWGVMTRSCLCSTPGSHGSICPKSLASAPASP